MDWRGLVTENWPYKAAALVLALLLWFNVTAQQSQEYPVPTQLRVEVQDSGWVVVSAPDQVTTVFQGRRGDVLGMSFSRSPPAIRHVIEDVRDSVVRVDLSADRVDFDRELNVRPVTIRPQRVEVHLEPLASARVPVQPSLDLAAASNFTVVRPVLLQPESVTVKGPRSAVRSLSEVSTEDLSLENLRRTVTRQLRVRAPPGLSSVEVSPAEVLATVEVDTLVSRTVRRPLERRGPRAEEVRLERDSVSVNLRGPRSVVEQMEDTRVRAYVEVGEADGEDSRLDVRVELPEGTQLTAVPEPDQVAAGATRDER